METAHRPKQVKRPFAACRETADAARRLCMEKVLRCAGSETSVDIPFAERADKQHAVAKAMEMKQQPETERPCGRGHWR